MATVVVKLDDGLQSGDLRYHELLLRKSTIGDYIDALEDAERAVLAPTGEFDDQGNPMLVPTLLASAPLMELHTLRRQIVSVGDITGDPFTMNKLRLFSEADYELIRVAAEQLDQRAPVEVVQRGRLDAADQIDPSVDGADSGSANNDVVRNAPDDAARAASLGGEH